LGVPLRFSGIAFDWSGENFGLPFASVPVKYCGAHAKLAVGL
jgi:hypothetical protein